MGGLLRWLRFGFGFAGPALAALGAGSPNLADEYIIDAWQTEDGLPENSVTAIVQTGDGYLWVSTFDGLARFDGVSFKVFHPDFTPGFPLTRIIVLAVDSKQWLWIGSEDQKIICLTGAGFVDPQGWGLPSGGIEFVGESPDGKVLVWAKKTASYYSLTGNHFTRIEPPGPPSEKVLDTLAIDQRWGSWERRGNQWVPFLNYQPISRSPRWGKPESIKWIVPRPDNGQWVIGQRTIRGLHQGQWNEEIHLSREIGALTGMADDQQGHLWLGAWGEGLFRVGRDGEVRSVRLSKSSSPEPVRSVLRDREGNIWIGTDGSGLFRLKPRIFRTVGAEEGLSGNITKTVSAGRDGKVWVLNQTALDWIDRESFTAFQASPNLGAVWAMLSSRSNGLWLGTFGGDTLASDGFQHRPVVRPAQVPPSAPRILFEDRHAALWIGTARGLRRVENGEVYNAPDWPGPPEVDVRALCEDSKGSLYAGLNPGGIYRRTSAGWEHFSVNNGLPDDHILALHADHEDTLWIATQNKGLVCWHEGRFYSVPASATGMPRAISSIIEDNAGCLWLGSSHGIHRLRRDAALAAAKDRAAPVHVDRYGSSDGVATSECSSVQPAVCKSSDGRLWFATLNGVAMVNPAAVPSNPYPPPVLIEEAEIDGRVVGLSAADQMMIANTDQRESGYPAHLPGLGRQGQMPDLLVPPGSTRVEIRYTAASFVTPGKVRFRYKLEGVDLDWVEAGAQRRAYFTKLPPAHYRFRVTACNNDGVWNERGAALGLIFQPFFWQTAWFKFVLAAALAGILTGAVRWISLRKVRARLAVLERERAVNQERERIARDIHDEVGASLTQLNLIGDLGRTENSSLEKSAQSLGQAAGIAREAVQKLDELVWAVNPRHDTITGLLDYLSFQLEEMLAPTNIRGRLDVPSDLPPQTVSSHARHQVLLGVKEALHNIIKYSAAREVWLRVALNEAELIVSVEDDGRGFELSQVGPLSNGIANMRHRIEEVGGRFEIASQPGHGTQVRFKIPVKHC